MTEPKAPWTVTFNAFPVFITVTLNSYLKTSLGYLLAR